MAHSREEFERERQRREQYQRSMDKAQRKLVRARIKATQRNQQQRQHDQQQMAQRGMDAIREVMRREAEAASRQAAQAQATRQAAVDSMKDRLIHVKRSILRQRLQAKETRRQANAVRLAAVRAKKYAQHAQGQMAQMGAGFLQQRAQREKEAAKQQAAQALAAQQAAVDTMKDNLRHVKETMVQQRLRMKRANRTKEKQALVAAGQKKEVARQKVLQEKKRRRGVAQWRKDWRSLWKHTGTFGALAGNVGELIFSLFNRGKGQPADGVAAPARAAFPGIASFLAKPPGSDPATSPFAGLGAVSAPAARAALVGGWGGGLGMSSGLSSTPRTVLMGVGGSTMVLGGASSSHQSSNTTTVVSGAAGAPGAPGLPTPGVGSGGRPAAHPRIPGGGVGPGGARHTSIFAPASQPALAAAGGGGGVSLGESDTLREAIVELTKATVGLREAMEPGGDKPRAAGAAAEAPAAGGATPGRGRERPARRGFMSTLAGVLDILRGTRAAGGGA